MSKVWPDWHDRYDFDEFCILRFAPEEPGVFIIRLKDGEDWIDSILYIDAAYNIKERLLEIWDDPPNGILRYITEGKILEFAFLKTVDPYTLKDGILEDLRHIRNP